MAYWRSVSQQEVDLIVGNELAIEIKGIKDIQDKHLKGLRALKEEKLIKKYFVVSLIDQKRITKDKIEIWPWETFLSQLWKGQIV